MDAYELLDLDALDAEIQDLDVKGQKTYEAKQVERRFILGLIELRKKSGITQVELARKTGLTQQVISNIEKMDRRPTLTNLIKYLLGLGIDINYLIYI